MMQLLVKCKTRQELFLFLLFTFSQCVWKGFEIFDSRQEVSTDYYKFLVLNIAYKTNTVGIKCTETY